MAGERAESGETEATLQQMSPRACPVKVHQGEPAPYAPAAIRHCGNSAAAPMGSILE